MTEKCKDCKYWVKDKGVWCMNGWSGIDRKDGHCHYEPKKIYKSEDDYCSHWKK